MSDTLKRISTWTRYCLYMPTTDKQLCEFLDNQDNVSLSIRMIIKAFISNYGTDVDVSTMDLRELLDASKLQSGGTKRQAKPQADKEPEKAVTEINKADIAKAIAKAGNSPEAAAMAAQVKEMADEAESAKLEPAAEPENIGVPDDMPDDVPDNVRIQDMVDEEEVIAPEVEVEPEKPKKLTGSSRSQVNDAQSPGTAGSLTDMMDFMGDN